MFDRLIDLVLDFVYLFKFWTVINDYEGAVILRFGRFARELRPGFHLKWPFAIERVMRAIVVPSPLNLSQQSLTTADGVSIVLSLVVITTITNIRRYLLEIDGGEALVAEEVYDTVSDLVSRHTWAEIQASGFTAQVSNRIKRRGSNWGLEVQRVGITERARADSHRIWLPELTSIAQVI